MLFHRFAAALVFAFLTISMACSAAKVTRAQLEALKPGDVVVFRYDKDGKTWKYGEKITKIEGDKIYYYPSKYEAGNSKAEYKITTDFDESKEMSRTKDEFYKYETDQEPDRRAIMWIE